MIKEFRIKEMNGHYKNTMIYRGEKELVGCIRDKKVFIQAAHFLPTELRQLADLAEATLKDGEK